jgi:serine/threonine protein kinase
VSAGYEIKLDQVFDEAVRLRALQHPRIVPVYGIVADDKRKTYGIVMEHLSTGSLHDGLKHIKTLVSSDMWPAAHDCVRSAGVTLSLQGYSVPGCCCLCGCAVPACHAACCAPDAQPRPCKGRVLALL